MNTVAFDPANKHHRKAVALFMKRNAWADSPIRFSYDPEFGSVADQVKAKMLTWYLGKESEPKKARVPKVVRAIDQKVSQFKKKAS